MTGIVFDEPITAGTVLIREAIQSQNYAAGVAGWWIGALGDAEFNNLTLRGKFLGTDYVVSEDGIFFYSGAPAAGNMVGSWAPADGADEFGNAYTAGLTLYSPVGNVFLGGADGVIQSIGASGNTVTIEDGSITFSQAGDSGVAAVIQDLAQTHGSLALSAGRDVVTAVPALFQVVTAPGAPTVGNQDTYPRTVTSQQGVGVTAPAYHYVSGAMLKCSADGSVSENWTVVGAAGAPAYTANFASGSTADATYQTLQFRKDAEDNVVIAGAFHCTAAITAASVFTLPAGYIPKAPYSDAAASDSSAQVTSGNQHLVKVFANGAVQIRASAATVANQNFYVNVTVPLGNTK